MNKCFSHYKKQADKKERNISFNLIQHVMHHFSIASNFWYVTAVSIGFHLVIFRLSFRFVRLFFLFFYLFTLFLHFFGYVTILVCEWVSVCECFWFDMLFRYEILTLSIHKSNKVSYIIRFILKIVNSSIQTLNN